MAGYKRRPIGKEAEHVLQLLAKGKGLTEAVRVAGIKLTTFHRWIDDSYNGVVSEHFADRFIELVGRPCDRCGALQMPRLMRFRKEITEEDLPISLRWCGERCELKWDEEEQGDKEK